MRACQTAMGLLVVVLSQAAVADKIERTVSSEGIPKISIRGTAPAKLNSNPTPAAAPSVKDFQVYQLDGTDRPMQPERTTPEIVVVSSPPPIAPNPAGYGYGYYGYPGFGPPIWGGYPGYGPYWGQGFRGAPLNYQTPPANYQSRPVNYQNPPVNYQNPGLRSHYRVR